MDVNERYAAPVLIRELGVLAALEVGRAIRRRVRAGEPFEHLAVPADAREAASRAQAGPAVVLYQELTARVGQHEAMRITREAVGAAGCAFLAKQLGPLRRAELARLDESGRQALAAKMSDSFFNATMEWDRISPEGVDFRVTACSFPTLCASAGVPELAPVFCEVDERYFETVERDVELVRPRTIARGGEQCDFGLRYRTP